MWKKDLICWGGGGENLFAGCQLGGEWLIINGPPANIADMPGMCVFSKMWWGFCLLGFGLFCFKVLVGCHTVT